MMNKEKSISLIIPCYNEEENVKLFYEETIKVLKDYNIEFVFINDGSKDKTLNELKEIYNTSKYNIKIIDFSRNFGKESAIYAGLLNTSNDYICLIDADLQQNPKYIIDMLKVLNNNEEIDIVAMYQKTRKENFFIAKLKNFFYKIINKLSEVDFVSGASDFRMFRKNVKDAMLELKEQNRFSKGIFSWVGFNTYFMEYTVEERKYGKSKWSLIKLFKYAFKGIMSFSTAPLKLASITGFLTSLISIIYLIVVIIEKLTRGIEVSGYATIVVLILFLGGLQLLVIGIIGEYIGAMYIENKNRPLFITRKIYNNQDKKELPKK